MRTRGSGPQTFRGGKVLVHFHVDAESHAFLVALAEAECISIAAVCRRLVLQEMRRAARRSPAELAAATR